MPLMQKAGLVILFIGAGLGYSIVCLPFLALTHAWNRESRAVRDWYLLLGYLFVSVLNARNKYVAVEHQR
jgi:hypothetical protein